MSESIFEDPSDSTADEPADRSGSPRGARGRRWWLLRGLAALIAVAMLAAVAVVGDSRWQAHERAVARKHLLQQEDGYLAGLRQLDDRIGRDIAPTMHVLKALATPKPADIFAARDAFANDTSESALAKDLKDLKALHPPAAWVTSAKGIRQAVQEMHDAVLGMRNDRDSHNFDFLANDLQSNRGGTLASGIVDWQQRIAPLFRQRHAKAPVGVAKAGARIVPPTLTSWVFGIDRACIAGRIREDLTHRPSGSLQADLAQLRTFAATVARLASDLRSVPVPRAQALAIHRDLVARWKLFDSEVKIIRGEADQLSRGDITGARLSVDRLKTLEGAFPLLDRAFRRYHAFACGGDPSLKRHHAVAT